MKVKIKISTPKGQAEGTAQKLKPFLIGFNKVKSSTYVSPDNDIIFLDIEGDARRVLKVTANAYSYAEIVKNIFKKKVMGKGIADALNEKDAAELENMLTEGTTVEVIKEASAEELIGLEKKSFWQTIKDKFRKVE